MSNFGQAVLTIGGTIVGAFFGNPQLGFFLGNLAGQALFPTDLGTVEGPRLDDLSVQSSALGQPIGLGYGTFSMRGNIIWSSGLLETVTTEEVGGKGGPSQTVKTYTYRASFAVGLVEGVAAGVRRIWAGGNLIYDRRPQLPGEDSTTFAARLNSADLFDLNFTFYPGTEDQLPDPTIQAYEGAANVPAFRGLCYAVLTDFELGDYGNNLGATQLEFEIAMNGAPVFDIVTEYEQLVAFPWENSIADPYSARNNHLIGQTFNEVTPSGVLYDTLAEAIAAAQAAAGFVGFYIDGSSYDGSAGSVGIRFLRTSLTGGPPLPLQNSLAVGQWYGVAQPSGAGTLHWFYNDMNGGSGTAATRFAAELSGKDVGDVVFVCGLPNGVANNSNAATFEKFADSPGIFDGNGYWRGTGCYLIHGSRAARAPDDPCNPQGLPAYPTDPRYTGFCVIGDDLVESETWVENTSFFTGEVTGLQRAFQRTALGYSSSVGPVLRSDDPNYASATFWQARYAEAVAAGTMPAGLTYGVDYPTPTLSGNPYYSRTVERGTFVVGSVTLLEIVYDVSVRCGFTAEQLDLNDLTKSVQGYSVGRVTSGRGALEPLRTFGFFDAVESGGRVKFVTRGKPAVATLTVDDLGAHEDGTDEPPALEITRADTQVLPRVLSVSYKQSEKDYEPGIQPASRLAVNSTQEAGISLPIVMTDTEAKQVAEVALFEAWIGRSGYRFALDQSWLELEPADAVNIPVEDGTERVRIVSTEYRPPGVILVEAVRDDADIYSSFAEGAAGGVGSGSFVIIDPSLADLLDLPALRDADDDPGYYLAARQNGANTWRGATLYRSADGGASFPPVASVAAAAPSGALLAALPSVPQPWVWDEGNTLQVQLDTGTLSSATEAAVLAGANGAAIGAPGRWEIVQFRNASLVSGTTWNLSGLLRGRRGTEHALGSSEVGDRFVLLSGAGVVRVGLELAAVGVSRPHRIVSIGQNFDAAAQFDFAGQAVALRPYSPVAVAGTRDGGGDLTVTWIRRGRIGKTLPDGTDIPLSEESEAYDVDVLNGPTVVRSLTSSTSSVVYTAAQQTTDFGSPQASVVVRVFQRSAAVGRGYPAEATV